MAGCIKNVFTWYLLTWSEWTKTFADLLNTVLLAGIFLGIWFSLYRSLGLFIILPGEPDGNEAENWVVQAKGELIRARGPFLEAPGKLPGPF